MDTELFRQIADDIYTVMKIKTVFYDAAQNQLYEHPDTMSEFCSCVRQSSERTERCLSCDREGFRACSETGEICVYRCHMGLFEVMAPVIEDHTVLGYIQFGQMLNAQDPYGAEERARIAIPECPHACSLLSQLPVVEKETVYAMARLIAMCTSYARLRESMGLLRKDTARRIGHYIQSNLHSDTLNVAALCRVFGISRSALYLLSKQRFGMGASDYIRLKRVEKARELLQTTDKTVEEIAETVGIYDGNYLTKLLKQFFGETARQVRKRGKMHKSTVL